MFAHDRPRMRAGGVTHRRRMPAAAGGLLLTVVTAVGCAGGSGHSPGSGGFSSPPETSASAATGSDSASTSASASEAEAGTPGNAVMSDVEDTTTQDGISIDATVGGGLGCPPSNGLVYPSSVNPDLASSDAPGTGPRQDGKAWNEAPAAFGAVDPFPVTVTIDVVGTSETQVTLSNLTIHVLSRQPKVSGVWMNILDQCGAGGDYAFGDYDLDSPPPYLLPPDSLPDAEQEDAIRFPYTVTQSAGQGFLLTIDSEQCECSWDAELDWSDGTTNSSFVIDDNGVPFQDSSTSGMKLTNWASDFASPSPNWTIEPY